MCRGGKVKCVCVCFRMGAVSYSVFSLCANRTNPVEREELMKEERVLEILRRQEQMAFGIQKEGLPWVGSWAVHPWGRDEGTAR